MSEYHIASFVVQCFPKYMDDLEKQIAAIDGLETHLRHNDGKLIVTAEGEHHKQISELTEQVRDLTGVLNLSPVYHQYMQDEVSEGITS